jgi:GNAT superfamily N-acetyltransferase
MVSFQIRDGQPADEAALAGIFRRSSMSNEGDRAPMLAHPEVLEFVFPGSGGAVVRVAVDDDDRALGFATLIEEDGFMELEDLFVDPDWMRLGLGTALMRDVCEVARARGVTRIEVTANRHASAFYDSVGFVTVGVVATRFAPGDRMHLRVT